MLLSQNRLFVSYIKALGSYDFHRALLYPKLMKVLLVGLGNASWLYAEREPNLKFITHTHSINFFTEFQLVAGCEIDKDLAIAWSEKFGLPVFSEISQISIDVDLVVIAVNHARLLDVAIDSLSLWPHARILVEKPFITSEAQLKVLQNLSAHDMNRIWINFPRIFQPETSVLKDLILEHLTQGVDEFLEWNGVYSGGFLNTSSHFISLINYLFGTCHLELLSDNQNFAMNYSIRGTCVRGSMLELDSPVSTGSAVITGTSFRVEYLDGGKDIALSSSLHGEFQISTTRSQYQLQVYRKLLEIWNGSESNLGTLSLELHNLRQMIYLQKAREVNYGPSN